MKTIEAMNQELKLKDALNELPLYEFIMNSFNIIISPKYWAERNDVKSLSESVIRKVTLQALEEEFGNELKSAETKAEKELKKACSYMTGLYEVVKLRLLLFVILSEEERKRTAFLLTSNVEGQRFGGLCSLRMNKYQAESLMPISKDIGFFIEELYGLNKENKFPEEEIISYLEQANDKDIARAYYLIDSGEENLIHGGLRSLMLSKPQCEACKEEGIDSVLKLIKKEQLKRESASLIEEFKRARDNLNVTRKKLEDAGFEYSEIEKMLECTKAFEYFSEVKSHLNPEIMAIAIA